MTAKTFDLGRWTASTIEMLTSYEALHLLLTDENTLAFHANRLTVYTIGADNKPITLPTDEDILHPLRIKQLEEIVKKYEGGEEK
jgi:hypothetical protein